MICPFCTKEVEYGVGCSRRAHKQDWIEGDALLRGELPLRESIEEAGTWRAPGEGCFQGLLHPRFPLPRLEQTRFPLPSPGGPYNRSAGR